MIDSNQSVLDLGNPPNAGILNTVGALGIVADVPAAYDIDAAGMGDASFGPTLYTIDVATGNATATGQIGGAALDGLTAVPMG